MNKIYIVTNVELGWDNIVFVSFDKAVKTLAKIPVQFIPKELKTSLQKIGRTNNYKSYITNKTL